jgi:hypothetical protein
MTCPLPQLRHLAVPILAALAFAACGSGQAFLSGDVCGAAASANDAVANAFAACSASDSSFAAGGYSPCFDPSACEESLKSCTAADKAAMQTVIACQNTYAASGDCSFAAINTYDTTCAGIATTTDGGNALSAACVKAFEQNPGICASDAGS